MSSVLCGGGVAGASACASGTADQGNAISDSGYAISTTAIAGQSFQVTSNGSKLYSITVKTKGTANGAATLTLRYGTEENLGTYLGSKQVSDTWALDTDKTVEFVIQDTTNTFNAGTAYYFAILSSATNVSVYYKQSAPNDPYANGRAYNTSSAADWSLVGHEDPANDLGFLIKVCN